MGTLNKPHVGLHEIKGKGKDREGERIKQNKYDAYGHDLPTTDKVAEPKKSACDLLSRNEKQRGPTTPPMAGKVRRSL